MGRKNHSLRFSIAARLILPISTQEELIPLDARRSSDFCFQVSAFHFFSSGPWPVEGFLVYRASTLALRRLAP
jgi:hypothetical protein